MAGTRLGVIKGHAKRLGMTLDEYMARVQSGEKWCTHCKAWHPVAMFGVDRHRYDGKSARCLDAPVTQTHIRDVQKRRARGVIRARVRRGTMPPANSVQCVDCGHVWTTGAPRHEYDHFSGYDKENADSVEALCKPCHTERGVRRGEFRHG